MSAYLVSDKTISTIVKSIKHHTKSKYEGIGYQLEGYHSGWLETGKVDFEQRLFALLLNINLLSLGQRYEDIKEWSKDGSKYEYDKLAPVVTVPCLLDLLSNWSYQACEGVAVETDFYKLIQKIQGSFAIQFINKGRDMTWGIDKYEDIKEEDLVYPRGSISVMDLMK